MRRRPRECGSAGRIRRCAICSTPPACPWVPSKWTSNKGLRSAEMLKVRFELAALASLVFCGIASAADAPAKPLLGPLFVDHAVLQRDKPINVWGDATPGQSVTVSL